MAAPLNFTLERWEQVAADAMAWWAGELPRPLVYLAVDPLSSLPRPVGYFTNQPPELPAADLVERYVPFLSARRYFADAFPWIFVNFGPGIAAGFMGATVHSVTAPSETVWFSPAAEATADRLDLQVDPQNWWWQRVRAVTAALVERFGGMLQVSQTDLGGNLDILASFLNTQRLLFDLSDQPAQVERLVRQITTAWLRYYDELDAIVRPACRGTSSWAPIWSTGKTYMLQSDFAYMISPAMFERFVMPDLAACCDHLDHGFYHLDGKNQIPHLDLLLSLARLRGIQWIPGDGQPSPDQWLPLLKRIRDGGKLCQIFVTPEGARRVVQSLGGRGFLFVIQHNHREFDDPARVDAFLRQLAADEPANHR